MRFSWKGLLLAPLLIPALFSAGFIGLESLGSSPNHHPLFGFLVLMVPACIVSYGTMISVFLPVLFVASRCWRMSWGSVWLMGAVLGLLMFVPVTALEWSSSGPDSGPPVDPFIGFLVRFAFGPFTVVFPVAGLVTAALYWRLGAPRGAAVSVPG